MTKPRGFTLPEMLTVMAIILIIITILMPIFTRSRARARYVRWKAYSARQRSDIDLVVYYNFEEQEIGDTILRNRAVGDPHNVATNYAVDPELRHGQLSGSGATSPEWVSGRWHGKGALDFDGSSEFDSIGIATRLPDQDKARSI